MPPPQPSSIGVLGFIAFVAVGALLSCSLHKIEEGLFICICIIALMLTQLICTLAEIQKNVHCAVR